MYSTINVATYPCAYLYGYEFPTGAVVYMACRDVQKAESARQEILTNNPQAKLKLIKVDLASLKSVRECADNFLKGLVK